MRELRELRWCAFGLLGLLGCGEPAEAIAVTAVAPQPPAASQAEVATPPPAPAAPAPPQATTEVHTRALMVFRRNRLDECVEIQATIVTPPGLPAWQPPPLDTQQLATSNTEAIPVDGCTGHLDGRPILATCETSIPERHPDDAPEGVVERVEIRAYTLSFNLLSDNLMRDCLRSGGRWSALPQDSAEFRSARLRYDAERLERQIR